MRPWVQTPVKKTPQKKKDKAWCQWLTLVILTTLEAEIRRIEVRGQTKQIILETLSWKHPTQKKELVEWHLPWVQTLVLLKKGQRKENAATNVTWLRDTIFSVNNCYLPYFKQNQAAATAAKWLTFYHISRSVFSILVSVLLMLFNV
jgi:hypothetical protein